ncbi:hypothetical protein E1288_46265 [Saccharopolyspora elongata]|uniref:Uncharacterized protein n=2 Tax=Saccharopolyspora elongata TaxID=2530387 RepID=A0A4R4XMQ5_9PSEU|nr:hypothetical protein E1288_46265 [Saccharopolyspora elongata]
MGNHRSRRNPRRRRLTTTGLTGRLPTTTRHAGRPTDPLTARRAGRLATTARLAAALAAGLNPAFTNAGRPTGPLATRLTDPLATTRLTGEPAMTTKLVTTFANAGRPTAFAATARLTGEPAITRLTSRLPTTARHAGRLTDPRTARHITAFAAGHAGGFGPGLPHPIGLTIGLTGGLGDCAGLIAGDNLVSVRCRPGTCPVGPGLRGTTQPEPLAPRGTGGMRDDLARAAITGGA